VAALAILGHTVALVLLSLLPLAWGSGWIYGISAVSGGGYFVWRAALLARDQSPRNAIRCFLASLLQLGLLLAGAIIDGAVRGSLVQF
jgi:protoheme IX farnesyltransferase